jgi:hypothetical protein
MPEYSYSLEQVVDDRGSRWIYKILNADGVAEIVQDYDPYESGWVPMSNERAEELAQREVEARNAWSP